MTKIHRLLADSYKYSHFLFYPEGTEDITNYIEPRGFADPFLVEPEVVPLGTRMFIQDFLSQPMNDATIAFQEEVIKAHGLPYNTDGLKRIVEVHNGYFPAHITALDEGSPVPIKTPLVQVRSLDPKMPWVAPYLETAMLRAIWYPTTVATLSREAKKIIKEFRLETSDDLAGLEFQLHDFGQRGASSQETAEIGGLAHLVNFWGTDTTEALFKVREHYRLDGVAGYSIPATEHTISTAFGPEAGEVAYAERVVKLLEDGAPMASIVSDTYDIYNFVRNIIGDTFKERIEKSGGRLVIRPDSGYPPKLVLEIITILGERFGFTTNAKGFKVLPHCVRMIQGDGINLPMLRTILSTLKDNGWSAENLAFGMGGGLLQSVTRDTLKFAQKANEVTIKGVNYDIYKDPVTDPGKTSKRGKQTVALIDGRIQAFKANGEDQVIDLLKSVYSMSNGYGTINKTEARFDVIRERAKV